MCVCVCEVVNQQGRLKHALPTRKKALLLLLLLRSPILRFERECGESGEHVPRLAPFSHGK